MNTTSIFGTVGSCTCGFADVPPELPCEVHDDALEVSLEHPGRLSNLPHDEPDEEFNEPDEDYYRDYVE